VKKENLNIEKQNFDLWQIFHSAKVTNNNKSLIVFSSPKAIQEKDFVIYEIMHGKLVGIFEIEKNLSSSDKDYDRRFVDKNFMESLGFKFNMPYQYKIKPIIELFDKPLLKNKFTELSSILKDYNNVYVEKLDKRDLGRIKEMGVCT